MKSFAKYLSENNSSNVIYILNSFEYQMIVPNTELESFCNSLIDNELCTKIDLVTFTIIEDRLCKGCLK